MTKDEALKMAIEALESFEKVYGDTDLLMPHNFYKSLKACKEALALSEKQHTFPDKKQSAQEPVAWMNDIAFSMDKELLGTRSRIVPLYNHPAPSWQGLSNDEIGRLAVFDGLHHVEIPLLAKFILAIEQALKEKNNAV